MSWGFGKPLPYTEYFPMPATPGSQVLVNGTPSGNRFEVNLLNSQGDIVLHINPRFDQREIVLNNAPGGNWGAEEKKYLSLQNGVPFQMQVLMTPDSFKIAFNGQHAADFHNRMPYTQITQVQVKGDLRLDNVQVFGATSPGHGHHPHPHHHHGHGTPPFVPPATSFMPGVFPGMGAFATSIFPTPPVPAYGGGSMGSSGDPSIKPCVLHPGSRISLQGYINPGAQRFEVNLLHGYSEGSDVAFHFNPRFDQQQIVKNWRINGQWQQEENTPLSSWVLTPGQPFNIHIYCHHDRYQVLVQNQQLLEFRHRIPVGAVTAIQVKGDVSFTGVQTL